MSLAPGLTFGAVVRRSRRRLTLLGVSALLGTLSLLALPLALANAVDAAVTGGGAGTWTSVAAGLILLGVVCDLVDAYAETACAADAAAWLRGGLVRRMLGIPHRIREFDPGDLVARTSAGAADASQAGPSLVGAVASVLPPVGGLAMLLWLHWTLAVAFAVGLTLVALVLRLFAKETAAAAMSYQRVQGRMAGRLTEAIAGRRTIAAAGTVEAEVERVLADLPELAEHGRASWRAVSAAGARAAFTGPLATVGVLAVAGFLVGQGRLSAGEVLAAVQYAMLGAGLGSLTGVLGTLARAKAAVTRLAEIHHVPELEYGERELTPGEGRLELRSVTVRGEAGPLLEDVSVSVPGGAVAAVVGASGAGKSVLAAVAARLRDPDEGDVLLDGVPLQELTREALRDAVGIATERPALAGETLADAMGPGRPREEVLAGAAAVGAHAFAERLPEGYETPLEAVPMSGGEAQRIGLARVWRAERLLVLDDATAALDAVSELRIAEALAESGRTRIVVTHKAQVAAEADLVVWLHGGLVRGVGPHQTLRTDPDYRKVFHQ
jgi:ATP-binding cassette subfamily B protein